VIVYGDPGREEALESMVASLRETLERTAPDESDEHPPSCDALRRVLIQAGELEHAVCEAPASLGPPEEARRTVRTIRSAMSHAARAFDLACDPSLQGNRDPRIRRALLRTRRALDRFTDPRQPRGRVWVEIPDGFSFEALFPEHGRAAAVQWAEEHAGSPEREVLVAGIRGIGTTLSAVIAAALRRRGFRARRITVRPKRDEARDPLLSHGTPSPLWGLLVRVSSPDSEIESAKEALSRAGASRVEILDVHSPNGSLDRARLGTQGLPEALWASLPGAREDPLARVTAYSGGAWRAAHRAEQNPRLAEICRSLERPKLLCEGASGRRILFKFVGLASAPGTSCSLAEVHARQIARLAAEGLTPAPLGVAHGFVATEWLEGRPLRASDATPDLLRRVGSYIAAAAGPRLSDSSARASRVRLETMLCRNAAESLGGDAAVAAGALLRPVPILEEMPRAGDGHLAPHEWIATTDGRILKTDAGGHDLDPIWTGRQPVLWDLAGAILEWDLDELGVSVLLEGFTTGGGPRCAPMALDAYRAAYAAHRLGQVRHGTVVEKDACEREHLDRGYQRWRAILATHLGLMAPPSSEDLRVPEGTAVPFAAGVDPAAPLYGGP
jgi:hypothetical protein